MFEVRFYSTQFNIAVSEGVYRRRSIAVDFPIQREFPIESFVITTSLGSGSTSGSSIAAALPPTLTTFITGAWLAVVATYKSSEDFTLEPTAGVVENLVANPIYRM